MRDVAGGRHHRHSGVVDPLTRDGGGVESIVALSYAVLGKWRIIREFTSIREGVGKGTDTKQCNWWNTAKAERWGARSGCWKKPPCSGKRRDQAMLEASEGAEPNMGAYSNILE